MLWEPGSLEVPQKRRMPMGDAGSLPKAVTHQALPVECGHGWKARAAGSERRGEWWVSLSVLIARQGWAACDLGTVGHDRKSQELRITALCGGQAGR